MIESGYRKASNSGSIEAPILSDNTADTVGCIVIDSKKRVAATSSTGGISNKKPGRVGDSPVIGSGAYATNKCAASATGYGEHIMRVVLSHGVVSDIEHGKSPMTAAKRGIRMFGKKTGSEAGIITADTSGKFGFATNAKAMPITVIRGTLKNIKFIICTKEK
jgi:beta-aspartyl-peptidase (threonine type)